MSGPKQSRKTHRKPLAQRVQASVDRGADTAEEIHKKVLDLPLEVLARSGVMQDAVKELRGFQDKAIGAVYDLVRDINHSIAELAGDVLGSESAARRPARARRSRPKKRPSREHKAA